MALPPPSSTLTSTLGPKAALLGEFAKFWDLDGDIDELAINEELSGARVGALIYDFKEERDTRKRIIRSLRSMPCLVYDIDYKTTEVTRSSNRGPTPLEVFMNVRSFKLLVMMVETSVGQAVRNYYLTVEQAFKVLHRQNRAQVEAALAEATARALEHETRTMQLSNNLEKMEQWYTQTAELLDSANERLAMHECDDDHPQRIVSLPPGTIPAARCMETDYGRELARKVFHDAAIVLWRSHEEFEHRFDPSYWNTFIKWHMNVDIDQGMYRSHINVYTAMCKAANVLHGVPKITHLTYTQLYDVLRRLVQMHCDLVQKTELELVFGDQIYIPL